MTEVGATGTQPTKRGASFSELEQVNLTQSWIEVSLDPIHGNDQKGSDFYKKISEIFKHKMGTQYITRSPESLHSHWRDNIQCNVAKFSSAYTKATSKVISGYNPDDYIRDAQVLFISESKNKRPFKAMKCWEILKSHAKWCPSRSDSPDDAELAVGPLLDRPIGCYTAKKAKIDAKSKAKIEITKADQLKQVIDTLGISHRDRQDIATKSYNMIEKSNALKELKFFEADTSEEGQEIAKELRRKYINKYVVAQAPTPTVGTVQMVPIATTSTTSKQTLTTPIVDMTTPIASVMTSTTTTLPVHPTPTVVMTPMAINIMPGEESIPQAPLALTYDNVSM